MNVKIVKKKCIIKFNVNLYELFFKYIFVRIYLINSYFKMN